MNNKANMLCYFRAVFAYSPRTGKLSWKISKNSHGGPVEPGSAAGTVCKDRDGGAHLQITLDGRSYRAHHIIWFIQTGKWPPRHLDVDHADGRRTNNRWRNLRLATRSQNNINNHKLYATNKSGARGVSWVKARGQWLSRINVDGKPIHLGMFDKDRLADAIKARRLAEKKFFGVFAPR